MMSIVIGLILFPATFANSDIPIPSEPEGKIVQGNPAFIEDFGFCSFVSVLGTDVTFVCGSSILNQRVLLTAAHCFDLASRNTKVMATAGSRSNKRGLSYRILAAKIHEDYDSRRITNDIALAIVSREISLGSKMYRVALATSTPRRNTRAKIAGWGLIDDTLNIATNNLHYASQNILSRRECLDILRVMPSKTICAGDLNSAKYPSPGDSGSALVIMEYLQVGIVSYKKPDISNSIIIYTDVSKFTDWIQKYAKILFCRHGGRRSNSECN